MATPAPIPQPTPAPTPAPTPSHRVSADKSSYANGESVTVSWQIGGSAHAKDWIALLPRGTGWIASSTNNWKYTNGAGSGSLTIAAPPIGGAYDVVLYQNDSATELARTPITVTATATAIIAGKHAYMKGETVSASWQIVGSASSRDWIAMIPSGASWIPGSSFPWKYTGGATSGTMTFSVPFEGVYQFVLFANDGYSELARSSSFSIGEGRPKYLKVMSYNIFVGGENGGTDTDLSQTADVIKASGADVVAIQEIFGNLNRLCALFPGWSCRMVYSTQHEYGVQTTAIMSRYPIDKMYTRGARIWFGGRYAYVFNAHLQSGPYQPYLIRDGAITTEADAIANARTTRGGETAELIQEMSPLISSGAPVFLGCDCNEPSFFDWTQAAANAGFHPFKVQWPASLDLSNAGLWDSYRVMHPNPVSKPGYTWSPYPSPNDKLDRIDFVYYSGTGNHLVNSQIVGESAATSDLVVLDPSNQTYPFPSDHRGLVSTFRVD